MIDCQRVETYHIQLLIDGRITSAERLELDSHLASCPKCALLIEAYRGLSRDTLDWAEAGSRDTVSDRFTSDVLAAIAANPARVIRENPWETVGIGAISVAALTAVVIVCDKIGTLSGLSTPPSLPGMLWIPRSFQEFFAAIRSLPSSFADSISMGTAWTSASSALSTTYARLFVLAALAANVWFAFKAAESRRATQ